jgi:outer membrane protein TolC
MFRERLTCALLCVTVALALTAPTRTAHARKLTLQQLLEIARKQSPSIAAAERATDGIEAQLLEARRSYLPSGELLSIFAPVPTVRCQADVAPPPGDPRSIDSKSWREDHCDRTNVAVATRLSFGGVMTRTEIRLTQPLYTFGKISTAIDAANAGVEASRGREAAAAAEVDLLVKRAYWSLKLALQVEATIKDGIGFLEDATKRVDKEIEEGGGASVTDRLRLKTLRAETDARMLEAQRNEKLAREGLKLLLGDEAPDDLELDDEDLTALDVPKRPLPYYEEQARLSRPEIHALGSFVEATQGLAKLEIRKMLPDLVLIGQGAYAYAPSIDFPQFAFANNPYNTFYVAAVLGLRAPLDFGVRHARALKLRADAEEADAKRREALGGIAFEVAKAYGELDEANARIEVATRGEKAARAWITAVAQNMELGLAEAKDFGDALLQYFNMRVRHLQAIFDFNIASAVLERATGTVVAQGPGGSG